MLCSMKQIFSVLISIISILFYSQLVHLQILPFRFRIITWNVGNSEPDYSIFEHMAFSSTIDKIKPDLIVFGFQETNQNLTDDSSFHKTLKQCLENNNYIEIISDYVGSSTIQPIWLYIYVLNTTMQLQRVNILQFKKETILKINLEKILENVISYKGVIASRIEIDKSINFIFVNMHLPAGEGNIEERCKLWSKFFYKYQLNALENDYMFAFGDQNWRTSNMLTIDQILKAIEKKNYQIILNNDELTQMHENGKTECLSTFFEAPITFPPTYKYKLNSDEYQTKKNNQDRRPSYTDRILLSTTSTNLKILQYSSMNDIKISDHRPVFIDIIFSQQLKDNNRSEKFYLNNTNENLLRKIINIKQSSKKKLLILIIIIILCILSLLGLYYFLIKFRKKSR